MTNNKRHTQENAHTSNSDAKFLKTLNSKTQFNCVKKLNKNGIVKNDTTTNDAKIKN